MDQLFYLHAVQTNNYQDYQFILFYLFALVVFIIL